MNSLKFECLLLAHPMLSIRFEKVTDLADPFWIPKIRLLVFKLLANLCPLLVI